MRITALLLGAIGLVFPPSCKPRARTLAPRLGARATGEEGSQEVESEL